MKHCGNHDLEAGVDWLTLTIADDQWGYRDLCRDWQSFVEWNKCLGNQVKGWGMSGYQGFSCGDRAIGYREGGAILRASGKSATEALDCQHRSYCGVPRIDLQITVWEPTPGPNALLEHLYRCITQYIHSGIIKSKKASLVKENNDGMTLYIGSRSSSVFLRAYNKGAETGESRYYGAIRYEVEYKGDLAKTIAGRLKHRNSEEWPIAIVGTVHSEFGKRGVPIKQSEGQGREIIYSPDKVQTDHERQLEWLRTQVAPTIARLRDAGRENDVIEALGLLKHDELREYRDLQRMGHVG